MTISIIELEQIKRDIFNIINNEGYLCDCQDGIAINTAKAKDLINAYFQKRINE